MFGLGFTEVLFLGVLALIVIGPKQLPEMARHLGRFLNELKRATDGITNDIRNQTRIDFDLNSKRLRDKDDLLEKTEEQAPSAEDPTDGPRDEDEPEKPS
ncbi:MAG TPA: twin-arginine translocase TatA/TatE family subunit [Pseudobdellovibrionaceae bacterium]|nr:twin-arginine translocase TatA/TatE family subunit [Pseudobdellovibrionaceae bacterium]